MATQTFSRRGVTRVASECDVRRSGIADIYAGIMKLVEYALGGGGLIFALVVQWLELQPSKLGMRVRISPRAPSKIQKQKETK